MSPGQSVTVPLLREIRARCDAATPSPWRASVERRDHWAGSSFIDTPRQQFEIDGATDADYDFIAAARQDIPTLLDEVERLRALLATLGHPQSELGA